MKKISVTYRAPPGDSKVLEAFGHTFFDGKAEDIEVDEATVGKLQGNHYFQCGEPSDVDPSKRDPEKDKAEHERLQRADDDKLRAQHSSGPVIGRGASLDKADYKKTEEEREQDKRLQEDDAKRDEQRKPDMVRGQSGGAPDPSQPQKPKDKVAGDDQEAKGKTHSSFHADKDK